MFSNLIRALHHLINPHCDRCRIEHDEESERYDDQLIESRVYESEQNEKQRAHELQMKIESNRCYSCEVLERQLNEANSIIRDLLNPKKEFSEPSELANFQPITPGRRWSVIQKEMEKKDRDLARSLKETRLNEITPETLEAELKSVQDA